MEMPGICMACFTFVLNYRGLLLFDEIWQAFAFFGEKIK